MIRVLNVLETIGSGGVERRRLSMAKLLDKSKYEVKIVCTATKGNIADEIRSYGVEVIEIGKLSSVFDVWQYRKVMQIITEFQPHIIHGAVFEGVTLAAVCGFIKRVPAVILEETSDPKNRSWRGNLLMKIFAGLSDKVIGVSPAATTYLTEQLGIRTDKVQLVLNGVALPRAVEEAEKKALRKQLNLMEDELVVGSVGRMLMDSHKRFSDLIKAFQLVLHSGRAAKLVLVGEGPELKNYRQLARTLNIENQVVFAGYQSDMAKFYSIFDVFCLVSAYEAFGLVLAEAMLHRLPVVATKVGGMQYIVEDKRTGFLVSPLDVVSIAGALEMLLGDAALRTQMGLEGYERAKQHFTESHYIEQLEHLYAVVLQNKKITVDHETEN